MEFLLSTFLIEMYTMYTSAAGGSNGVTNTRCCRYNCLCSW